MINVSIIHGSIRKDNHSQHVVNAVYQSILTKGHHPHIIRLEAFRRIFDGTYITYETATPIQRMIFDILIESPLHFYVVPTYYKGPPAILKNYLDIVRCRQIYDGKVIGIIASNMKNQDFGARQFEQNLNGILTYFDARSFTLPEIGICNPVAIRQNELETYLDKSLIWTTENHLQQIN